MAAVARAFVGKPGLSTAAFLCCDIQERFRTLIHEMPSVIATAGFMMKAARVLNVPVLVTEQYPKALKHTVEELQPIIKGLPTDAAADASAASGAAVDAATAYPVFEKMKFSMATEALVKDVESRGIETVVLFGVEAHVCVLQTAIDFRQRGFNVYVVADGTSSQRAGDRTVAFHRMLGMGVQLTTAESVLFELMETAEHPNFKQVSKLAVAHARAGPWNLSSL